MLSGNRRHVAITAGQQRGFAAPKGGVVLGNGQVSGWVGCLLPESVGLELVPGGGGGGASSTELRLEEQFEEGGSERATGNRRLRRNFLRRWQDR